LHYLLGWDEVGNLTSLGDTASNPNISVPLRGYTYDGLNRLTAANDPSNVLLQGYSYDATGNRLSDTKVTGTGTTAYTYPATSHQLTKVGTVARTYDAMGNMLTGTVNGVAKTFTYDVTGRMNVAKNGSTVQMNYAYNGKGEQVRRYPTTTSTAQTYEVYDEAGHWIGEYDSTGARKQEFIWLGDLPMGVYALSAGSTTAYQVYQVQPDHLGTPRAVIDATRQKAVWSWPLQNEPFGKSNPVQDPDADGKTFVLDMRFPGQRYDSGSGLNYNYYRDGYDAGTARYSQPDPIGLEGGASIYAYVGNHPIRSTDPLGLSELLSLDAKGSLINVPRGEFERYMSPRPLSAAVEKDLDRGCIGLASAYQGAGQQFPEDAPGTDCYKDEAKAIQRAVQCIGRSFIFGKQGHWQGAEPMPDSRGKVPNSSISSAGGHYNYVTYFRNTRNYAWMNHSAQAPGQRGYVYSAPPSDPAYPETIWCTTCTK
ncbi:RHS repeat-associated core domain-containing protein, partial [Cognatilysobacter lacus]